MQFALVAESVQSNSCAAEAAAHDLQGSDMQRALLHRLLEPPLVAT